MKEMWFIFKKKLVALRDAIFTCSDMAPDIRLDAVCPEHPPPPPPITAVAWPFQRFNDWILFGGLTAKRVGWFRFLTCSIDTGKPYAKF
jgi:hypothetical protein